MVPYLSRTTLESMAAGLVREYRAKFPSEDPLPQPIDPTRLAQDVMGLHVLYCTLSRDGSLLGFSCFEDMNLQYKDSAWETVCIPMKARDIFIDESLQCRDQIGRRNFTIAHELSHHFLEAHYQENCQTYVPCRCRGQYRGHWKGRAEWQANTMGAAVLMPPDVVRGCMRVAGLGGWLDILSPVRRLKEYRDFCTVAMYLGVSKKALAIRMQQLGLLGEDHLGDVDYW